MLLLTLHHIARGGDGLAPELLKLLQHRSALAGDPDILLLRDFNPAISNAAGHTLGTSDNKPADKTSNATDRTGPRRRHRTL